MSARSPAPPEPRPPAIDRPPAASDAHEVEIEVAVQVAYARSAAKADDKAAAHLRAGRLREHIACAIVAAAIRDLARKAADGAA